MAVTAGIKLFYKIGEVGRLAGIENYILRYWEAEFPSLAPKKGRGGQRVYLQRDLDLVMRIKQMLYDEGYTIAGAKKKLAEERASRGQVVKSADEPDKTAGPGGVQMTLFGQAGEKQDKECMDALMKARDEIKGILDILKN